MAPPSQLSEFLWFHLGPHPALSQTSDGVLALLVQGEHGSQPNTAYRCCHHLIFPWPGRQSFIHFTGHKTCFTTSSESVITAKLILPASNPRSNVFHTSFHILTTIILSVSPTFINSLSSYFDCFVYFPIFKIFYYFMTNSNLCSLVGKG